MNINIPKIFLESLILFIEASVVLALFENTFTVALILLTLSAVCFAWIYSKEDKVFYLVASIVGPLAEVGALYRGAWTYAKHDILLMPIWLPLAWGIVAVIVKRIAVVWISDSNFKEIK